MELKFQKPQRRHSRELNVVPILDMMTTLIIFLLQITSFLEYTKITIPPSSTITITDPLRPPPLSPKLLMMARSEGGYRLQLTWVGEEPGESHIHFVPIKDPSGGVMLEATRKSLLTETSTLVKKFKESYPSERSLQVGLSSHIPYQYLIAVMDGVHGAFDSGSAKNALSESKSLANIILLSYRDVDAEAQRAGDSL